MSDEPRVSILLPVRDAAATLPACLASIARQSETRFECVIVDDGSRDASPRIAEHRVARDPRFRLIRSARAGVAAASNRGLAECRAPFVARMDADDWMHRERLARQLAAFETEPDLAAVATRVRYFPRSQLGPGLRRYETWLNQQGDPRRVREDAFVECPVANPTLMLRRDRFRSLGYRECDWPEDYDLVLRLLAEGARIRVLPRRLHGWRLHPGRLTSRSPLYAVPRFTACKAHFLAEGLLRDHPAYLLWGYGRTGRSLARALRAHGRRPAAIVELHPGRLGQRIHGAPVIPPEALGAPTGRPLLASVAGAEARGILRRELARRGWRECVDFAVVA